MYLTRTRQCDKNVNSVKHSLRGVIFKRYTISRKFFMCNFCKITNLIIACTLFSIFLSSNLLQCIIADRE